MKIAQIAPLAESVPPKLYGGTERIVSYLTEELVRQGHDVTLFASGDSETSAKLDRTLSDVQNRQTTGGGVVVNLHEDASKAGQVRTSTNNGQISVDAWVANIMSDGEAHEAMAQKYGLSTVGS